MYYTLSLTFWIFAIFLLRTGTPTQQCVSSMQCNIGSTCVGSECVVLHCNTTQNCPKDMECQLTDYNRRCYKSLYKQISSYTYTTCKDKVCEKGSMCWKGKCNRIYGTCKHDYDCGNIQMMCVQDAVHFEGFCICTLANDKCGSPCQRSKECDKCSICLSGMCTFSESLPSCSRQCQISPKSICNLGSDGQCCTNCDCIQRCEGTFCSVDGFCLGPKPPGVCHGDLAGFCQEALDCPSNQCCRLSRCFPYQCCSHHEACMEQYANSTSDPYLGQIKCPLSKSVKIGQYTDPRTGIRKCACSCNGSVPHPDVSSADELECIEPGNVEVEVGYDIYGMCTCNCEMPTWTPWSDWSICSATCNDGKATRSRQRRCAASGIAPELCGNDSSTQTDSCGSQVPICVDGVDGNWYAWSSWTACTKTCGLASYGKSIRYRKCNNPLATCHGSYSEIGTCPNFVGQCPFPDIDGAWSPWSLWSPCSKTCGSLTWTTCNAKNESTRQRSCTSSYTSCIGSSLESRACSYPRPNRKCCGTCQSLFVQPDACVLCSLPSSGGVYRLSHIHFDRCIFTKVGSRMDLLNTNMNEQRAWILANDKHPILASNVTQDSSSTCPIGHAQPWLSIEDDINIGFMQIKCAANYVKTSHKVAPVFKGEHPWGLIYHGGAGGHRHFFSGKCCRAVEIVRDNCVGCFLGDYSGLYIQHGNDSKYISNKGTFLYRNFRGSWSVGTSLALEGVWSGKASQCPHEPDVGGWWYVHPEGGDKYRRASTFRPICHY